MTDEEILEVREKILDSIDEILYEELAGLDKKDSDRIRSLLEGYTIL